MPASGLLRGRDRIREAGNSATRGKSPAAAYARAYAPLVPPEAAATLLSASIPTTLPTVETKFDDAPAVAR